MDMIINSRWRSACQHRSRGDSGTLARPSRYGRTRFAYLVMHVMYATAIVVTVASQAEAAVTEQVQRDHILQIVKVVIRYAGEDI